MYSRNDYLGTTDKVKTKLNFTGQVEVVTTIHEKTGQAEITTIDTYTYDPMGRLKSQMQKIDARPEELIVLNTYDDLGQLEKKKVGGAVASIVENSSGLQKVDYTYNIRGWLKQINDPTAMGNKLFAFKINYNTNSHGGTNLFNGNISETEWRTANDDNSLHWYRYSYDALNRLTDATDNFGKLKETLNYDKNGNITDLVRLGHIVGGTTVPDITNAQHFGVMDNLGYTYGANSNKLLKVADTANKTYGFRDGTNTGDDYAYDVNGNMVTDPNKGISAIAYNYLNLPKLVTLGNGNISYIYDAMGTKLSKKVVETGKPDTYTYYAGNYVYGNSSLKYLTHPEGYVDAENNFGYVYQYKNHLRNVRLSYSDTDGNGPINASTEILEENNYYPFGLEHNGYNSNVISENNFFNYVGKELNESLDYNMLEMDWRHYDPAIGRFVGIGALAENYFSHTPYHYSKNNPIWFKDPTGLFTDIVNEETGEVYNIDDGWDFRFVVSAADFTEISEFGAIPKRLRGAWQNEFWSQVWKELTTSDGSVSDDVTQFVIIDEIEDGVEAIDQVSNGQYKTAVLTIFLRKVQKAKKGYKLIEKLFKYGKKGKMPTPDLNPEQFKKVGDKLIHKETGAIFSKSKTSHGNVGNTGDQWKAWSKGDTDFGNTSKKTGARVTIDGDGNVIGN